MFPFLVQSFRADHGGKQAMLSGYLPAIEQPLRDAVMKPEHRLLQNDLLRILQVHGVDRL